MTLVTLEREGGVAVLTLDHVAKRNAFTRRLREDLLAAISEVAADDDVRALVVASNGPAFSAGGDLGDLLAGCEGRVDLMREGLLATYRSFLGLTALRVPTIAAVQGPAIGAGLNLALCCDIRIAGPAATFDARFAKIGLSPGGGCTVLLAERIGRQAALELLLRGGRLGADEAVRAGLASRVVDDPLADALDLARATAAADPFITRDITRMVRGTASPALAAAIQEEAWAQAASLARNPSLLAGHVVLKGDQR
jgi:enoyl-CoA hydratase